MALLTKRTLSERLGETRPRCARCHNEYKHTPGHNTGLCSICEEIIVHKVKSAVIKRIVG